MQPKRDFSSKSSARSETIRHGGVGSIRCSICTSAGLVVVQSLKKKTWKRAVFPGLVVRLKADGQAVDESKQHEHYDDESNRCYVTEVRPRADDGRDIR